MPTVSRAYGWVNRMPPIPGLLLDAFPNAAFAYSLRKLLIGYGGSAVRIRESGGNTEKDFAFDVNGNFDSAGAAAFIGGNSGFITKWYDQSGNGLDVTQGTATTQPGYIASGVGGRPSMTFDGGNDYLIRAAVTMATYVSTQGYFVIVHHFNASTGVNIWFDWNGAASTTNRLLCAIYQAGTNNDMIFDLGDDQNAPTTGGRLRANLPSPFGFNSDHLVEAWRDGADLQQVTVDGSININGTRGQDITSASGDLAIGSQSDGASSWFDGQMTEFIGWGTDLGATNRPSARTNINSYYRIF